jgi:hypothetical protein
VNDPKRILDRGAGTVSSKTNPEIHARWADVISGPEWLWVLFSLTVPLVAAYLVVRLAVKHELAAAKRREQDEKQSRSLG